MSAEKDYSGVEDITDVEDVADVAQETCLEYKQRRYEERLAEKKE